MFAAALNVMHVTVVDVLAVKTRVIIVTALFGLVAFVFMFLLGLLFLSLFNH